MARRSTSRSTESGDRRGDGRTLVVGVIRRPHGVRGEVLVAVETDNPVRFRPGQRLEVEGLGERAVLSTRGTRDAPIVRLEGIEDRAAAEQLRGRELRVPIADARAAAEGYLWADLVGLRVEDEEGRELGTVVEVLRPGGDVDVFVVRDADGRELLLPAIESVVRRVDLAERRIVARPQEEA